MYCLKCGANLKDTAIFCENCGMELNKPSAGQGFDAGRKISENIYLCGDGKYRWVYELSLFKNPTIFMLIWKIFFFVLLGIFVFMFIIDLIQFGFDNEMMLGTGKMFIYFFIGMTVLVGISYLIYAAVMGGKYCVLFTMDEDSITHEQMPKQVKKAQAIAMLSVMVGVATGNRAAMAGGIAASQTSMTTEYKKVRKMKCYPKRHVMKVNKLLYKNQVYAAPGDFEFVRDYIAARIPETAKRNF